jgi:hypothetical protein
MTTELFYSYYKKILLADAFPIRNGLKQSLTPFIFKFIRRSSNFRGDWTSMEHVNFGLTNLTN